MGYREAQLANLRDRLYDYKDELSKAIDSGDENKIRHYRRLIEETENLIEGYEYEG